MLTNLTARFTENPLLVREMRRSPAPTISALLFYGFGLSFITAFVNLALQILRGRSDHIDLTLIVFYFIVASVPPFAAYTAAALTAEAMGSSDLVQVTTLSNAHLFVGYVLSALYRSRRLVFLLLGAAPLAIIGTVYLSTYKLFLRCPPGYSVVADCPSLLDFAGQSFLNAGLITINLCITGFLSIVVGVVLAGSWRDRVVSSVVAAVLGLGLLLILISISMGDTLQQNLIYLPILTALCLFVMLASRRFMRKHR